MILFKITKIRDKVFILKDKYIDKKLLSKISLKKNKFELN